MRNLKALLGVAIVAAGFYAAFLIMPPYFNNFQFQDTINSEARLSAYSDKSEEAIREVIYKRAQELELPLRREQIKVRRDGTDVVISASYRVHVDLPGYPMDIDFAPQTRGKR
jgi:hypothetical protein